MKKILGILGLLLAIFVVTWIVEPKFVSAYNLQNIIRWTSLFGIISIGVAFVIITGGIDLSIGSLIGLVGCLLPMLLAAGYAPAVALLAVVVLSLAIGLMHGLLITRLGLQPFVVTLCGLLFYRGFARWLTHDQVQGFGSSYEGLRQLAIGKVSVGGGFALPIPFFLLVIAGVLAALFLNRTIWGRYLLALGRNETAARYSGIQIERMKVLAYVLCSGTAGLGGILFALDVNSVQPAAHGNFYELYAIAAAVLGGCSLRGGEGSILGVVIGAAVMRLLYNAINVSGIPTQLEFAIIGAVILAGVIADELIRRVASRRRAGRGD
ncbi:MAG: ABC transporter permease [Gemmatimonadetes bacterium]|nr:ABC transporter permease [Gemmatimonadota bacterium]MDE2733203.1 ABC transporter permease [Gemmatimonadota bacterium]